MYFYESLVEDKLVSISLWFYTYILLLLRKDMGNVCTQWWKKSYIYIYIYRGADKSLARPTSRCILFDGQNISFDASLVMYMNSTNISPIMITYKQDIWTSKYSVAVAFFLPGRAKDLSAPLYVIPVIKSPTAKYTQSTII